MQDTGHTIWAKTKHLVKLSSLSAAVILALSNHTFAAKVPEGTILAEKQEVHIQATAEAATLDPQKMEGTGESALARQLLEGLVNTDEHDNLVAGVAERWEYGNDNKSLTFYLRKDAKWSNGDPVTAHDFVYAWQRLADPKTASPYATYLEFMKMENVADIVAGKKSSDTLGVKAIDDHTLQLTLTAPVPYAADLTQHSSLYPVHRATIEKHGDNWIRPENFVGNGAYRIAERVLNEKLVFERNPHYWNDKETVINRATIYVLNESAGIARYRSGELDIANIPATLYKDPKFKSEYESQIHKSRKLGTFIYEMNLAKAPFNDIRVRKALDLAVDRQIITDKVLGFGQTPTFTFTPFYIGAGNKIQQPEYANWTQAQRNKEAKKLLAEAGYSKNNPLKTTLLYNTNEGLKNIAVAVTSMWKKNLDGMVEISLKNMEWKTFLDTKNQKDYTLAFAAWMADYNDASTFLTYYLSNSDQNKIGFKSEKFDKLINDSYYAKDENERAKIYAQAESELDSHHPFVAIYHYAGLFIKNPKLKGYEGKSPQGRYFIKDFYIEK
ncbi:ABC transporter substrate-binding protein [Glaesserella parasuis]|uniref:ABC transporter substrate-binding protein n=5 Tax=Glaesserella parasuis TaxID=738 RepID=A0AAJ6AE65_GLAPU|nr:ABC transporter substrate-binding protein [Glaesserella parasuis]ATW42743.1 oligopeptide ABC transporter substrate-binding protein OppA [Glaesserella parasuis D74]MCT8655863.1 oligopeptide ABC transporter substrate-binding protein OppA [Glaesserella parasuis]MDD2166979.1 ABC transporter substrate-binding protein [Glaesserella parasuis]MDD2173665.1 ABC transporter substrate-binding protein [Glaesserella parasuis]MDG6310871.1 ABC transporter substrate-binding protein [Glaesserella parasuis]